MPELLNDTVELRVSSTSSTTGNVLSNDPDSAGTLSVAGTEATAEAQTLVGDHGFLSFAADGSYTYTPFAWTRADMTLAHGGTITETFSYSVTDGGNTETADLSINLTVLQPGQPGAVYGNTGNAGYTTSDDGTALFLGYAGSPGNGTFTEIAYDFAGDAGFQATWLITPSGGEDAFSGMLNDDGSVSRVVESDDASDGWVARVITSAGVASETQANQIATAGSIAYTWAAIAEEENGSAALLTQGADIEAIVANLSTSSAVISIATYTDAGLVETTSFDFLSNPGQTYTADVTDLAGTALGTITYRADGVEIFNDVDTQSGGQQSSVIRGDQTVTDTEDAFAWAMLERSFDVNGLAQNVATLDNGDVITTQFGLGGETTTTFEDVSDARGWQTQTETRDGDGDLTADSFVFDDGLLLSRTYDADGDIATRSRTDAGDNRAWASVEESYTDGTLRTLSITQDDGDVVTLEYDASGVLTTRTFIDNADTQPWETRIWTYDNEGTIIAVETDTLLG